MAVKVAVFLFLQKYESLLFPWIHFFPTSIYSERGEAQIFLKTFFWGKNNAPPLSFRIHRGKMNARKQRNIRI